MKHITVTIKREDVNVPQCAVINLHSTSLSLSRSFSWVWRSCSSTWESLLTVSCGSASSDTRRPCRMKSSLSLLPSRKQEAVRQLLHTEPLLIQGSKPWLSGLSVLPLRCWISSLNIWLSSSSRQMLYCSSFFSCVNDTTSSLSSASPARDSCYRTHTLQTFSLKLLTIQHVHRLHCTSTWLCSCCSCSSLRSWFSLSCPELSFSSL